VRLQSAILARYAEVDEHGLLNVIGGGLDISSARHNCPRPWSSPSRFSSPSTRARPARPSSSVSKFSTLSSRASASLLSSRPHRSSDYHEEHADGLFAVAGSYELFAEQAGNHSVRVTLDGEPVAGIPYRVFFVDPDAE
jgi:hypothetical protein